MRRKIYLISPVSNSKAQNDNKTNMMRNLENGERILVLEVGFTTLGGGLTVCAYLCHSPSSGIPGELCIWGKPFSRLSHYKSLAMRSLVCASLFLLSVCFKSQMPMKNWLLGIFSDSLGSVLPLQGILICFIHSLSFSLFLPPFHFLQDSDGRPLDSEKILATLDGHE